MSKLIKSKMFWILLAGLAFRVVLSFLDWHPDVNNHADWGIRFWQYLPSGFYTANVWNFTWPNQPPGTIYMFAGIRKLFEFVFSILWQINVWLPAFPSVIVTYAETNLYPAMLKLPAIFADLGIGYLIYRLVYKFTGKVKLSILGLSFWIFNPVVWYNSAFWGQYDSVINFWALLSAYLLIEKKLSFAVIFMAISIYTKASLLIFLPIFVIFAFRQKYSIKQWLTSLTTSLLVIGLITLPFATGEPFSWLFKLFKDKIFVNQLHVVTANGFNLWGLLFGVKDSAVETLDSIRFAGLPYSIWSYVLFSIFYLPSLVVVWKKQDIKSLVWSLTMAAFASFMLLTNMHERYLFPLFPYLTILVAINSVSFISYFFISLINLLNLYNFWFIPNISFIVNIMSWSDRLLPRILGGVNFILFLGMYRRFWRFFKSNNKSLR